MHNWQSFHASLLIHPKFHEDLETANHDSDGDSVSLLLFIVLFYYFSFRKVFQTKVKVLYKLVESSLLILKPYQTTKNSLESIIMFMWEIASTIENGVTTSNLVQYSFETSAVSSL